MKRRSILAATFFLIAILALVALAVTKYVQPILPPEISSSLVLAVAAILGAAGFLAALNEISELIERLFGKQQAKATSIQVGKTLSEVTNHGATTREPPNLEAELKLQERREKAEETAQVATASEISLALAELYRAKGELEKAERYYQAAKSYYSNTTENEKLARATAGLVAVYTARGRQREAIDIAKDIERMTSSPSIIADVQLRLGICYRRLGRYSQALNYLNQSLETWDSLKDNVMFGETLIAKGDVYRKMDNWIEAEQLFAQSAETLKNELLNDPNNGQAQIHLGQARFALGRVYIEQKRYKEAEKTLNESFLSLEKIGNFYGIEMCAQLMGRLYKIRREWKEARRWYHESFVATAITRNELRRIETLFYMAELAYLRGETLRAQALASTSAFDAKKLSFLTQLARLLMLLGHISCDTPVTEEAATAYKEAILVALRTSPTMVDEIFSRLTQKLTTLAPKRRQVAEYIVRDLIEWWPKAVIDSKKAEQVEAEQISLAAEIQNNPKRVTDHLLDLLDAIR